MSVLQRDGLAFTTAEAFLGPQLWADLQDGVAARLEQSKRHLTLARKGAIKSAFGRAVDKSSYLTALLGDRPHYDANSVFVQVAQCPALMSLAEAYLPKKPYLKAYNLWHTRPTDQAPRDSQLWHQDGDDDTILKIFVYLSDVTEDAGPLVYLPGTHKGQHPIYPASGIDYAGIERVTDDDMLAVIDPSAVIVCTGEPSTVVVADTTGWHKGGHGPKERLVYTAMYTTVPNPHRVYYL